MKDFSCWDCGVYMGKYVVTDPHNTLIVRCKKCENKKNKKESKLV